MALLRSQEEKSMLNRYSSFMIVETITEKVVKLLMNNERLKRLLYYSDRHALSLPKLTQEQSFSLIDKNIKTVPKLEVDMDTEPYILISFDNFVPQPNQTTFRSITLEIDIFCSYKDWQLNDFKLRPYSIAGEIDALLNNSFVTGVGLADFTGAQRIMLNPFIGGISLYYNLETFKDDIKLQPTV